MEEMVWRFLKQTEGKSESVCLNWNFKHKKTEGHYKTCYYNEKNTAGIL